MFPEFFDADFVGVLVAGVSPADVLLAGVSATGALVMCVLATGVLLAGVFFAGDLGDLLTGYSRRERNWSPPSLVKSIVIDQFASDACVRVYGSPAFTLG